MFIVFKKMNIKYGICNDEHCKKAETSIFHSATITSFFNEKSVRTKKS